MQNHDFNIHQLASEAASSIEATMNNQPTMFGRKSIADMIGGESIGNIDGFAESQATAEQALKDSGLVEILMQRVNTDDPNDERVQAGIKMALITMSAAGDASAYAKGAMSRSAKNDGAVTLDGRVAGIDAADQFGGEGFDKHQWGDFVAVSTVVNALSATTNSFEEVFFKTVVVPPGKPGLDMTVRIPYAYNRALRDTTGAPNRSKEARKPLITALRDSSTLRSISNQVVPYAPANGANDAYLVADAKMGSKEMAIAGVDVLYRPIKIGAETDLLALSGHPGLVSAGAQDQTDTLAPGVNLGEVFVEFDDGTASSVVGIDISSFPGALFDPVEQGDKTDLVANFRGTVQARDNMTAWDNTALSAVNFHTSLGVTAGTEYHTDIELELVGRLDELGNIKVQVLTAEFKAAYTGAAATAATAAQLTALKGAVSITVLGYLPKAARSNSNLRDRGILIDAGNPINYRIPVYFGSPIAANTPVSGEGGGVGIEDLSNARLIRNSNNAIITIQEFETTIARTRDLPNNSTAVGSALVDPTYRTVEFDAVSRTITHQSATGMDNLRAALSDAVSTLADKLALESGYLSALEMESGSTANYEVIVGTDPRIANMLMTSGDARAMGAKSKFNVVASHDTSMVNRIYVSFRRTDVQGASPLSFGVKAEMPPLIFDATVSSSDATFKELQMIPRTTHAVTCPILGRIDVTRLDEVFYA